MYLENKEYIFYWDWWVIKVSRFESPSYPYATISPFYSIHIHLCSLWMCIIIYFELGVVQNSKYRYMACDFFLNQGGRRNYLYVWILIRFLCIIVSSICIHYMSRDCFSIIKSWQLNKCTLSKKLHHNIIILTIAELSMSL